MVRDLVSKSLNGADSGFPVSGIVHEVTVETSLDHWLCGNHP